MSLIEVFADVCCPFTHVGLRRLAARRAVTGRDDLLLRVRSWPLELVNGAPLDAGLIGDEVDQLRSQVAPDLFAGFDPAQFPADELPAFDLAASAYARSLEAGEEASLLLRDALFERGRPIGEPAILQEIATTVGIPMPGADARAQVHADWHEGQARGVIGSPHFFVGDEDWFCPSLDITKVDGRLRIRFDPDGFEAFISRCLSA